MQKIHIFQRVIDQGKMGRKEGWGLLPTLRLPNSLLAAHWAWEMTNSVKPWFNNLHRNLRAKA